MLISRIALGALALAGCTASAEMQSSGAERADRELAEALKDRTPGTPTDCISSTSVQGPQIIDRDTLLYRESGRVIWRNELAGECPGLSWDDTIVIEIHGGQLCKNDLFRPVSPGSHIPGPTCRLGQFTPYRKN